MATDGRCREAASDTEDTEAQRNAEEFRPHEWFPAPLVGYGAALLRYDGRFDMSHDFESTIARTKVSKGVLHAYRIECTEPELNRTYFVIDGDEGLYMLAGPVTQELHTAILSGLRVVEAP